MRENLGVSSGIKKLVCRMSLPCWCVSAASAGCLSKTQRFTFFAKATSATLDGAAFTEVASESGASFARFYAGTRFALNQSWRVDSR